MNNFLTILKHWTLIVKICFINLKLYSTSHVIKSQQMYAYIKCFVTKTNNILSDDVGTKKGSTKFFKDKFTSH